MTLDQETLELLADAIADRLDARRQEREQWVPPSVVAERFGVDRDWVYAHAEQLGAIRLGDGPRARLRFRLDRVEEALSCLAGRGRESAQSRVVEPKRQRPRRRLLGTGVPLLPIRGGDDA